MALDDLHRLAGTRMERVMNCYLVALIMGSMWLDRRNRERRTSR